MYWFYNICLVAYWILQIPLLIYRLVFEEGFYDRLKQSAGIMPTPTLLQTTMPSGSMPLPLGKWWRPVLLCVN